MLLPLAKVFRNYIDFNKHYFYGTLLYFMFMQYIIYRYGHILQKVTSKQMA